MNVLIINTFDIRGGAARAAYRLHKGLNRIGIHSFMLVKEKGSQDEKVYQINPLMDDTSLHELEIINNITNNYIRNNRTALANGRFSLGYPSYNLANIRIVNEADVINLHWVDKFQSTESIFSLVKLGKPIIWTLHDQNPFTGGCHYSAGCILYKEDCKTCPQLANDPYQLPHFNLKNKIRLLQDKKITIVTPSRWLANTAKQSMVFRNSQVVTIPNSIEIDLFTPQNKKKVKRKLGISEHTVTILTGVSRWKPKRKGFTEFLSSMRYCLSNKNFKNLVKRNRLQLLCLGTPAGEIRQLGIPYQSFGNVYSDLELCDIYNASDMFILPSTEDNLPNTMVEAMACGTPVIAFDAGGMPDMIQDGITGKLMPLGNTKSYAEAIIGMVFNPRERNKMGDESRRLIENHYKLEDQAQKYAELFLKLLSQKHSTSNEFASDLQTNQDCALDASFNNMIFPLYRKYDNDWGKK